MTPPNCSTNFKEEAGKIRRGRGKQACESVPFLFVGYRARYVTNYHPCRLGGGSSRKKNPDNRVNGEGGGVGGLV